MENKIREYERKIEKLEKKVSDLEKYNAGLRECPIFDKAVKYYL